MREREYEYDDDGYKITGKCEFCGENILFVPFKLHPECLKYVLLQEIRELVKILAEKAKDE